MAILGELSARVHEHPAALAMGTTLVPELGTNGAGFRVKAKFVLVSGTDERGFEKRAPSVPSLAIEARMSRYPPLHGRNAAIDARMSRHPPLHGRNAAIEARMSRHPPLDGRLARPKCTSTAQLTTLVPGTPVPGFPLFS